MNDEREPVQELPMYQSHKVVWAIKIGEILHNRGGGASIVPKDEFYSPFDVDSEYIKKHKPLAGGYFVKYKDGYVSWSPAEAFEEGYSRHQDPFRIKVLRVGHKYELANFENDRSDGQIVQFIEKAAGDSPGKLETVFNGTTNEAVIEMLIDRMNYLQARFPCDENERAISDLNNSLLWLEKRTSDRKKRNVEGKYRA